MPPAIKIGVLSDRTQTIRASVADVEFTLLITIGLVVLVIFVFLRNSGRRSSRASPCRSRCSAPSALMYLARLQPRQPVAHGADDRGRLRRRRRDRDAREHRPPRRGRRDAHGCGATRAPARSASPSSRSASRSIAVFIPLLLMGGIVGRLFREFAVVVTMTIAVSAFVSLTLTPMMARACSRRQGGRRGTAGSTCGSKRVFDGAGRGYERGLDVVLRHHFPTLCFFATLAATVHCSSRSRRASSRSRTPASSSARRRPPRTSRSRTCTGASRSSARSSGGSRRRDASHVDRRGQRRADAQHGPHLHHPEASGGAMPRRQEVIARLRPQARQGAGRRASSCRPRRTSMSAAGQSRTQYQYTLQDANLDELNEWAPKFSTSSGRCRTARRRDRPADERHDLTLTIDRDQAARFGFTPQADRRHALRCLRAAAGHAVFHPAQQLQRDHGGPAGSAGRRRDASTGST